MKGTLDTRPIYVRTAEHIHAHLIICFIALTIMRVIQHKIKSSFQNVSRETIMFHPVTADLPVLSNRHHHKIQG